MKLYELESIFFSRRCDVTLCVVYDSASDIDIATGISPECAVKDFGHMNVNRISVDGGMLVLECV